ncbi:uncharacterized protein LOC104897477 [Beta vulgaris subsp. vulgaris]|uniref:uncharacterized protein LOC104897477 n=1 Tax=Beta vulgaris subsp. vulgaris TaxID=3555 RepID=UPI00203760A1|nr:uncharacterized protein LOC104897477 [Beta vulgaris subsp. vulgaris]
MAAELHPIGSISPTINPLPATIQAHNITSPPENPGPNLAPKRQRRPSVRLHDIGDQPTTIRTPKTWRLHPPYNSSNKSSSKIRPLTNLPNNLDFSETTSNGVVRKKTKRVRTNFKVVDPLYADEERENHEFHGFGDADEERENQEHEDADEDEDDEEEHSDNNLRSNTRVFNSQQDLVGVGFEPGLLDDGVRKWLVELGLGRYAPVFQIHEVDEQVLPFLTLDDLKDMGIHAVGSRRKLYSAILNLRKD